MDHGEDKVELLCPQIISKRTPPLNLKNSDLQLFQHEFEKVIPPAELLELRNVNVSSDGFIFRGFRILPISFAFPHLLDEWRLRSKIKFFGNNRILKRQRRLNRKVLWIVDDWSYGYFHWLADALPRLYAVQDRIGDCLILLPHQYQGLGFVEDSLKAFGINEVEFIAVDEVVLVDKLLVPTPTAPSGHYRNEIIAGVRKILKRAFGSQQQELQNRIYISRGRSAKRRISNEDDVTEVLSQNGFTTVYAENHPFRDQVRIASESQFLVSNHGAGLTNMLFMRDGGSVLELRHARDSVNNCYFTLASALDINYFYQTCESVNRTEDPHTADLFVDTELLSSNLKMMLEA